MPTDSASITSLPPELDAVALGLVIGRHRRQRRRRGVERGDVEGLPLERGPDGLIADRGHLPRLRDLERIVRRSERVVAPAVGVDAVGDLEVVEPEPVLFEDRGLDGGAAGLVLDGGLPEDPVDQKKKIKEETIKYIVAALDTLTLDLNKKPSQRFKEKLPNNAYFMNFRQYQSKQNDFWKEYNEAFQGDLRKYIADLSNRYPFL